MSKTTLTLLTQGTSWDLLRPTKFKVVFTEDTSIARVELWSSEVKMSTLLNVVSDTWYDVTITDRLHHLLFVPDDVLVEKPLRITNILWDTDVVIPPEWEPEIYVESGDPSAVIFELLGVTWLNGVATGGNIADLEIDAYVGMYVTYRGATLGIITSNTASSITISNTYTDSTPRDYNIYSQFGARLLNMISVPILVHPPTEVASTGVVFYKTAPPYPFESNAVLVERLSNVPTSIYSASSYVQQGLPFVSP